MKKHFSPAIILVSMFLFSFFVKDDNGTVKSIFLEKRISETPFADHIKEDLKGEHIIMFINYGCWHCWTAINKMDTLQQANLVKDVIVFGSDFGDPNAKSEYAKNVLRPHKMYDYDWTTVPRKFTSQDPTLPQPPLAFYIKDNVIRLIFVKMPTPQEFKAIIKNS